MGRKVVKCFKIQHWYKFISTEWMFGVESVRNTFACKCATLCFIWLEHQEYKENQRIQPWIPVLYIYTLWDHRHCYPFYQNIIILPSCRYSLCLPVSCCLSCLPPPVFMMAGMLEGWTSIQGGNIPGTNNNVTILQFSDLFCLLLLTYQTSLSQTSPQQSITTSTLLSLSED